MGPPGPLSAAALTPLLNFLPSIVFPSHVGEPYPIQMVEWAPGIGSPTRSHSHRPTCDLRNQSEPHPYNEASPATMHTQVHACVHTQRDIHTHAHGLEHRPRVVEDSASQLPCVTAPSTAETHLLTMAIGCCVYNAGVAWGPLVSHEWHLHDPLPFLHPLPLLQSLHRCSWPWIPLQTESWRWRMPESQLKEDAQTCLE